VERRGVRRQEPRVARVIQFDPIEPRSGRQIPRLSRRYIRTRL
jgi:hypothetical protein